MPCYYAENIPFLQNQKNFFKKIIFLMESKSEVSWMKNLKI